MPVQTTQAKRLVTESLVSEMRRVDEKGSGKSSNALCIVEGPCMEFGKVNQNNRIYSRKLIEDRIINYPPVKEAIKNKCMLGEGGHPETRIDIAYPEVALSVEKIWIPEDSTHLVYGRFAILDTPVGRILKTLIDYGSKIGISARALAESKMEGNTEIMSETEYDLITFDAVPDPGFKCAHLEKVQESKSLSSMSTTELKSNVAALNALKIPAFESRMHAMVDELEKRTDDAVISEIVRRGKAKINALSTGRKNEGRRASVSEILTGIKNPSTSYSDFNTDDITIANEAFERVSIAPVPKSAVNERRVYSQKEANESRSVNEAYLRISELEMELEASQQKVDEMTQKFESARDGMNFYKRDNESLRNGIAKSIYQAQYLEKYSELACKAESLARKLDDVQKRAKRIVRCIDNVTNESKQASKRTRFETRYNAFNGNKSRTNESRTAPTNATSYSRKPIGRILAKRNEQMKTEGKVRSVESIIRNADHSLDSKQSNVKEERLSHASKRFRIDENRLKELRSMSNEREDKRTYERRVRNISNFERDVHELAPTHGVFLTGKGK